MEVRPQRRDAVLMCLVFRAGVSGDADAVSHLAGPQP